jgi:hypothetical protein
MQIKKKLCDGCSEPRVIWKNHKGKRYCKQCWSCHADNVQQKPTVKQTPLPRVSEKRSKEERLYSAQRIIFLREHCMCEAHIAGICTQTSEEVHHKEGRTGENYLDITKWLAACHACHVWITDHPEEAIELGFSLKRIN